MEDDRWGGLLLEGRVSSSLPSVECRSEALGDLRRPRKCLLPLRMLPSRLPINLRPRSVRRLCTCRREVAMPAIAALTTVSLRVLIRQALVEHGFFAVCHGRCLLEGNIDAATVEDFPPSWFTSGGMIAEQSLGASDTHSGKLLIDDFWMKRQ